MLALSDTAVDLGEVESIGRVDLLGAGSAPVGVNVGSAPSWLSVLADQETVGPGERVALVVRLDRATAPVGRVDTTVAINAEGGSGGGKLRVTASVAGPPALVAVAAPVPVRPFGCPAEHGATEWVVSATVNDPTGVFGVEVETAYPDGRTLTVALELVQAEGDRSTWTGRPEPAREPGIAAYVVTATDLQGRTTEVTGSVTVQECPAD